jgi:hypothetical protein
MSLRRKSRRRNSNKYSLRLLTVSQSRKLMFIVGSVPYGLPCIAMTRRTIDLTLRNKQIEMINDKICKVMR